MIQRVLRFPERPAAMEKELIIDSFAGAGGVSIAIEEVFGRSPDIAINHNKIALDTHAINHPSTRHVRENIWKVDPRKVTGGRPVGLFWASPDCTHFSKAKGGKPVKQRRRGLANIVVKWARDTRPRVIGLENVQEFQTWGPVMILRDAQGRPMLSEDGKRQYVPNKARAGEYFSSWKAALTRMGYVVEHRMINAADFGAPTTRERFFLIARRDGLPIKWPEPSHGKGRPLPWRSAAECIDFNDECPSIFDRKKPLAEATLRRIAMGIVRYVLEDPQPFAISFHSGKGRPGFRGQKIHEPLRTLDTSNRFGIITPSIVQVNHGGKGLRGQKVGKPLPTLTGKHGFAVVSPTLMTNYTGHRGRKVTEPLPTQTTSPHHYKVYSLLKHYTGVVGQSLKKPAATITTKDHQALSAVHLTKFYGTAIGQDIADPVPVVTSGGGHIGLVAAFLVKYYGTSIGAHLRYPLDTVTTKPRFAVVVVTIGDQEWVIADIGMRMLQPRELARAHDFPEDYFLLGTKEQQVAMIGNSVPWRPAAALLRENFAQEISTYEQAIA